LQCHASHDRQSVGRKACLSCHTDKRGHNAGAPRCQACHPFGS
jgi:hypothetical protein